MHSEQVMTLFPPIIRVDNFSKNKQGRFFYFFAKLPVERKRKRKLAKNGPFVTLPSPLLSVAIPIASNNGDGLLWHRRSSKRQTGACFLLLLPLCVNPPPPPPPPARLPGRQTTTCVRTTIRVRTQGVLLRNVCVRQRQRRRRQQPLPQDLRRLCRRFRQFQSTSASGNKSDMVRKKERRIENVIAFVLTNVVLTVSESGGQKSASCSGL
jgi:hypothetical protein